MWFFREGFVVLNTETPKSWWQLHIKNKPWFTSTITAESGAIGFPSFVQLINMGRSPLLTEHDSVTRSPCFRGGILNGSITGGSKTSQTVTDNKFISWVIKALSNTCTYNHNDSYKTCRSKNVSRIFLFFCDFQWKHKAETVTLLLCTISYIVVSI